jgi:hypothetical protein
VNLKQRFNLREARCAAQRALNGAARGAMNPGHGKIFFSLLFQAVSHFPSKDVAPLVTLARSAPVTLRRLLFAK